MKLLFLSRCYYPAVGYGGPIFKMAALAERLVCRGNEVTVWTTDRLTPSEQMPGAPFEREYGLVRVIYHRTGAGYRWDRIVPGFGSFCREQLSGFDAIHIFGYRDLLAPFVCARARKRGIPYVLEPLGSLLPHLRSFKKKWLYDRTLGRPIVGGARFLIATSAHERADFMEFGIAESRIAERPNGINLEEFDALPARGGLRKKLEIPDQALIALFLGRINPKKGLERLIASMEQSPEAYLVIAGPADEPEFLSRLRRLAASLRIDSRVRFVGPVYDAAKLEALADADLFVLPSDRENFGNSVAEAIACRIPVIVTDRCGIAPLVENRAGIVIPPDVQALANALRTLTADGALRSQYSTGCAAMRDELAWDGPLDAQERIYHSLVPA
jgi:glycosyltransferase involved in cell wall biosynthesis